jgi:hypothetical protein
MRNVGVGRVGVCMLCTYVSEEGGDGEALPVPQPVPSPGGYGLRSAIAVVIHTYLRVLDLCLL